MNLNFCTGCSDNKVSFSLEDWMMTFHQMGIFLLVWLFVSCKQPRPTVPASQPNPDEQDIFEPASDDCEPKKDDEEGNKDKEDEEDPDTKDKDSEEEEKSDCADDQRLIDSLAEGKDDPDAEGTDSESSSSSDSGICTAAGKTQKKGRTTTSGLRVRSSPKTGSFTQYFDSGAELTIWEQNDDGDWYCVTGTDDVGSTASGWVSASYVSVD